MGYRIQIKKESFIEGINQFSPSKSGNQFYLWPYLFMMYIGIPLTFLAATGTILGLFMGFTSFSIESAISLIVVLYIPLQFYKLLVVEINLFSTIRVVEEGLSVKVFSRGYDWEFIPWEDVIDVIPSPFVVPNGLLN